jgi:hypothetical protein
MAHEFTSNGIRYKSELVSPEGASFIVFKDAESEINLNLAIEELKNTRDVVYIRKANLHDKIEDFREASFKIAIKEYNLHWSQFEASCKSIRFAIRDLKTPEEYAKQHYKKWSGNPIKSR